MREVIATRWRSGQDLVRENDSLLFLLVHHLLPGVGEPTSVLEVLTGLDPEEVECPDRLGGPRTLLIERGHLVLAFRCNCGSHTPPLRSRVSDRRTLLRDSKHRGCR